MKRVTSLFLSWKRETYEKKTINKLINDTETITDPKLILKEIRSFTRLYTHQNLTITNKQT